MRNPIAHWGSGHCEDNRGVKIAAVQMISTPEVVRNLETAARLVGAAAASGAHLVALPEYFCLLGRRDGDKLAAAERAGSGPIQQALAELARRHRVWLIGGTLPIAVDALRGMGAAHAADGTDRVGNAPAQRVLNRSCVYAPDGHEAAHYDKLHLFAFDNGRESYDEGRTLAAGTRPVALDCDGWRVGLSICYDLRFPELYRTLMQPPCDLVVVPSAFTHTTGQAHWGLLLRARAVENQCYVLAPAQGGRHENGRRTWGHSMIVDPWGVVLACRAEGEGVVLADASRERIDEIRRQLPALAHRRL